MMDRFLQWLYPNRCLFCRRLLPAARPPVCTDCRVREIAGKSMFTHLPSGLPVVTALIYRGLSRQLLLRYKFRSQANLCRPLANLMVQALTEQLPDASFDCVTWVPTGFLRLVRRGYDQSGLLAREIGRALDFPCRRLLVKRGFNRRQSSLDYDRRAENVRDIYRACQNLPPQGTRVLLVDDVVTSGATLSSAADVLLREGYDVMGLCLENAIHKKTPTKKTS